MIQTVTLPATKRDIGEFLSSQFAAERLQRRQCFVQLLSNVPRQALPLSGDGDEMDSNFTQLLKLRGEDDPRIFEWIKKTTDKYTLVEMQNEMTKVMSFQIVCKLASALQNTAYYTIMIDETTDVSNWEQVGVCFRNCHNCLVMVQVLQ